MLAISQLRRHRSPFLMAELAVVSSAVPRHFLYKVNKAHPRSVRNFPFSCFPFPHFFPVLSLRSNITCSLFFGHHSPFLIAAAQCGDHRSPIFAHRSRSAAISRVISIVNSSSVEAKFDAYSTIGARRMSAISLSAMRT
jgi:hypothetical protein